MTFDLSWGIKQTRGKVIRAEARLSEAHQKGQSPNVNDTAPDNRGPKCHQEP